ncbi:hypothetical protein RRF57_006866 [Xylaria bambusicola]|uniref:AAA+ ATPase domain-containing protein n=1 Tax=Xylaria bambusicola TaxID=326684 RepID=A0AAN7USU9_9PEZI
MAMQGTWFCEYWTIYGDAVSRKSFGGGVTFCVGHQREIHQLEASGLKQAVVWRTGSQTAYAPSSGLTQVAYITAYFYEESASVQTNLRMATQEIADTGSGAFTAGDGPSLSRMVEVLAIRRKSPIERRGSPASSESLSASTSSVSIRSVSTGSIRASTRFGDNKCEVKVLYEGPPKCPCCKNWVEEYPDDVRVAVDEQPDVKLKALVVRMRKNHGDGKPLVLDSIVVQSPSLKETLGEVFQGYSGITASLKKVVFRSPFRPFYSRWQRFGKILERQKKEDPTSAAVSQLLYDVLYTELHDTMTEIQDLIEHRVITYPLLWTLFEPGKLIVQDCQGEKRFYIFESCSYREYGCMMVTAKFVDWDSHRFGYATQFLEIGGFNGTRNITELELFPAQFLTSREEVEAVAIKRGAKFQALRGFHYMAHEGFAENKSGKQKVDGRIIIDAASFFHANPSKMVNLTPLNNNPVMPEIQVADETHLQSNFPSPPMLHPGVSRPGPGGMHEQHILREIRKRKLETGELPLPTTQKSKTVDDLTREQLLLCSPHVRGYSLKLKNWFEFRVEDVYDIAWNDAAFSSLILPKGLKDLILAFVEGQSSNRVAFDDVIEGKGQGIVMMLVGNPGTGKTLTAEAIADKIRKPLYILSAGELGQDAENVEHRLRSVLTLTEKWNAILLFDECDVLIQERTSRDLAHGEIVAVFLRLLEYYRGILFMTSNRAEMIDRAFHSRIHLTLHYPDLKPTAREHIWRQFASRSQFENRLTDDDIKNLAELPLNGRQIKNVVKIATLLAAQQDMALGMDQIRTVLEATRKVGLRYDV